MTQHSLRCLLVWGLVFGPFCFIDCMLLDSPTRREMVDDTLTDVCLSGILFLPEINGAFYCNIRYPHNYFLWRGGRRLLTRQWQSHVTFILATIFPDTPNS